MKRGILLVFSCFVFLLTGCWDKVEIDQRAFVSSIGIDLNKGDGMNRFIVSYEYPNINAIGKDATEENKIFVVSTSSSSIFQAAREFTTRVALPFYFKHVKVVVLGGDLVNQGKLIREVVDELNRDTKINKKIQIIAVEGRADHILKSSIKHEQTTDGIIYTMLREGENNANRFSPQTLTGFIKDADYFGATLIPRVTMEGDEIIISGGCIMKDYKHIAWIGERENRALSIAKGQTKLDTIDIPYRDSVVSYTVTDAKSSKRIHMGKEIVVDIPVKLKGYLQGYISDKDRNAYDDKILKDMEESMERFLKGELVRSLKLIQDEYNADIIGVGEDLNKFHHKEWEKIKDNWDEIFPQVKLKVSVDVSIRRTGLIK